MFEKMTSDVDKKSALTVGFYALLAAGVMVAGCFERQYQDRRAARVFASLPTTNVTVKAGETVDMITGRYVDKDQFPAEPIRRDQFERDNSIRDVQGIREHESYKVRYDPKYMKR